MEQEKIDLIAEKVMGWKKDNYCVGVDVYKRPGISSLSVSEYNPFTNLAQAVEALEKFCDGKEYSYMIYRSPEKRYSCGIITIPPEELVYLIRRSKEGHSNMSEAICLDLIEAKGGKG